MDRYLIRRLLQLSQEENHNSKSLQLDICLSKWLSWVGSYWCPISRPVVQSGIMEALLLNKRKIWMSLEVHLLLSPSFFSVATQGHSSVGTSWLIRIGWYHLLDSGDFYLKSGDLYSCIVTKMFLAHLLPLNL